MFCLGQLFWRAPSGCTKTNKSLMTPTGRIVILHLIIQVELFTWNHHKTVGLNSPTRKKKHTEFFSQIHNLLTNLYRKPDRTCFSDGASVWTAIHSSHTCQFLCPYPGEKEKIYIVRVYQVISSGRSEKRQRFKQKLTFASFQAVYSFCGLYQVNVDFGMAQSSSTSITGHHSGFNISHLLLSHQTDSKVLVHLNTNSVTSVTDDNTDSTQRF